MILGDILREMVSNCDCRLHHYWIWLDWQDENFYDHYFGA